MLRSVGRKILWVGRTTSTVFGLALVMALLFGVATMALGATGSKFILGKANSAGDTTQLTSAVAGPVLKLVNNGTSKAASALELSVPSGKAPLKVNSGAGTATNLSADKLDGKNSSSFAPVSGLQAKEVLWGFGPLPRKATFTSHGGTLLIMANGSGFRNSQTFGTIGMDVYVLDSQGSLVGSTYERVFTNEKSSHKTFVPRQLILRNKPAGTYTVRLEASRSADCNTASEISFAVCTTTDANDNFNVTVLEIPD
jgi:hypothetical protein